MTGGTGFIGAHSAAAIHHAGHRLRLLVRDPRRLAPALVPLGVPADDVEVVVGDVTDPSTVDAAVDGCDAVLHAASVYSFDSRRHRSMAASNIRGTEIVLSRARRAGADPIVHVSTFGALLPSRDTSITPQSPVGAPRETYLRTKARADTIARQHQADGAPVVITYPMASLGPHDPHLGDQASRVRDVLRGLLPIWPDGGFPVGDVRDVARLHAALLRAGQGPRRYFAPGRYVSTREFVGTLREVTGRRLPTIVLPSAAVLPVGRLASAAQRLLPTPLPVQYGAVYICRIGRPVDGSATDDLLDQPAIPLRQSMADTVRWLHATGAISDRQAGDARVADALGDPHSTPEPDVSPR
ncbi:NAD-dependent epimerase/dehydratase family protein [Solwaraspora sp. WMMD406]|uniref:NAD-dependent epimerase/dehydratase family protein n=1 Tax=Solwaraspora sp. WMMD406 TaxID=3016095 RepID=UPI002415F3BD|nr:NAD-dependent epimerase/dehydratase family protein [Solwaraspora sp. WMMD406]MDG4764710.1 NAD-dependent epimerase/dehydratase family protein [Solwaraspora sp. WMMD406]